jgi:hypothetical protein
MISSVEEFLLLLRKWRAEGTRVRLLSSFVEPKMPACRAVLRLSGTITGIDEQTSVLQIGDKEQFALIGFAGCQVGYGTGGDPQLSSQMIEAERLEDLVCLVTPSSNSICIYTVK